MIEHTQSNTSPGNCLQTAIACLLGVDPSELPDQVAIEAKDAHGFSKAINKYLRKHHGLTQVWLHHPAFLGVMPRAPGFHLIQGDTSRTPQTGVTHVVVGKDGVTVWDPHPSRAGLTKEKAWVVLVAAPEEWEETWAKVPCVCPSCAEGAR